MNIKALVSPLALASALALTGGVAAQDMMIGDQPVSTDDMALVQNFCKDLAREDSAEGATASGIDDTEEAADNVNDTFTNINFDRITLDQCEEGGFLD